ncbi:ankyrin repeat domain-containing protein SOWAHA [Rhinophrynus dorsalis]
MAVTQEDVMNFLLQQGGKVKNSELLKKFKPLVDSHDPQEKANNRELFKRFVNNIAVVKDEEGSKVVALKKKYLHLVTGSVQAQSREQENEPPQKRGDIEERSNQPLHSSQENLTQNETGKSSLSSWKTDSFQQDLPGDKQDLQLQDYIPDSQPLLPDDGAGESANPTPGLPDPTDLTGLAPNDEPNENEGKRESVFDIVARMDNAGPVLSPKSWANSQSKDAAQKPFMLPLRYPQPSLDAVEENQSDKCPKQTSIGITEIQEMIRSAQPKSPHVSRRQYDDTGAKSPHIKRTSKMIKVSEEHKYSDVVPLESSEHEWLVKATSGHWNHRLHGLLLTDSDLAEKRDFISGFTALHWAAKSGDTSMASTLINTAHKSGINLNVNVKSFGGYTPLHIAAIHDRQDFIIMLVAHYNANADLRDHSGRKPYQYLKKQSPVRIKILLKDPHAIEEQVIPIKRNSKVATSLLGSTSAFLGVLSDEVGIQELAKGLKKPGSLNKFFIAPTGQKKKFKARDTYPSISSLCEEEETEELVGKRRPISEFFNY